MYNEFTIEYYKNKKQLKDKESEIKLCEMKIKELKMMRKKQ